MLKTVLIHLAEINVLAVGQLEFQSETVRLFVDVDPLPGAQGEARRRQVGDRDRPIVHLDREGDGDRLRVALVHV